MRESHVKIGFQPLQSPHRTQPCGSDFHAETHQQPVYDGTRLQSHQCICPISNSWLSCPTGVGKTSLQLCPSTPPTAVGNEACKADLGPALPLDRVRKYLWGGSFTITGQHNVNYLGFHHNGVTHPASVLPHICMSSLGVPPPTSLPELLAPLMFQLNCSDHLSSSNYPIPSASTSNVFNQLKFLFHLISLCLENSPVNFCLPRKWKNHRKEGSDPRFSYVLAILHSFCKLRTTLFPSIAIQYKLKSPSPS